MHEVYFNIVHIFLRVRMSVNILRLRTTQIDHCKENLKNCNRYTFSLCAVSSILAAVRHTEIVK